MFAYTQRNYDNRTKCFTIWQTYLSSLSTTLYIFIVRRLLVGGALIEVKRAALTKGNSVHIIFKW